MKIVLYYLKDSIIFFKMILSVHKIISLMLIIQKQILYHIYVVKVLLNIGNKIILKLLVILNKFFYIIEKIFQKFIIY